MSQKTRWGVIGGGFIATLWARDVALLDDAEVVAVGSSRPGGGNAFAAEFGLTANYDSYEELVNDPNVDAVYVATPHSGHHAAAMLAINAGKAVLVEKPITLNAREAQELVDAARAKGVFLMEAMWTNFLPHILKIRELIAAGELGDLVVITAEQGLWFDPAHPEHRLYDPDLGGGALLDLGIYPVSLILSLLGEPASIAVAADFTDTGVDATTSVIFRDGKGAQGIAMTTLSATTPNRAVIAGTEARIEIEDWWMQPSEFVVVTRDGDRTVYPNEHTGHGLRHEAAEVGRCLREGLLESPTMPHDFTLMVMRNVDAIRAEIGLRYAAD